MPGKRSSRKQIQHFCCPYCNRRLWRSGSTKHFLFYTEVSQIRQYVNVSHKNAALLASQGAYLDRNAWIEEFFCGEHGKIWLKINRNPVSQLTSQLATSKDWQQTTRTINPEMPNPSVSEFTYRMSRPPSGRLSYCTR